MLLITVLIVGAVALTIGLSVALRGIGELDMGFAGNRSLEALSIADGCMEEAMIRLWSDYSYTGATLTVGDGTCSITVVNSGTGRTITVSATINKWTRQIRSQVDIGSPKIGVVEWEQE
jgi:hypothetical protein